MPQYPEDQTNGRMFTRHWVGEPKWLLASQSEFDGLAPSQIVRYANAEDRGFCDTESQFDVAARLDATPDADNLETNLRATELDAKGVTVDAHRYVVDPLVEQHQYVGLYTAGPVRHVEEQVRDGTHKRIQQVLTRTFCAGHGYFVDELGRYHPVWKTAGGGWTGVNPDKKQVVYAREDDGSDSDSDMDETLPDDFTPDMVREYATADEALMAHRPWLESKLSPYMALHPESFPNTFVREVYWREFTHESIAALEELGSDRARLERVVAYHFTEKVAPQVLDAHCRLDPQTNTVIFVCSLMYVELGEPQTPDDLLDLPCIVAPCTRDTLRMFGWNQLRDGEGYRYTHVFKWPRLKDTPEVRKALEFVQDNHIVRDGSDSDSDGDGESWIVALLRKHSMNYPQNPGWVDQGVDGTDLNHYEDVHDVTRNTTQADRTGRLTTLAEAPRGENPNSDTQSFKTKENNTFKTAVQFYRIAQQKCDIEQDGSLSFSIVLQKTEWHGADDGNNYEDGGTRQLVTKSNLSGWGASETRVIPSVPRENAISTLLGITASADEVISNLRQTEGEGGHSDVSFEKNRVWTYSGDDYPPDTQTLDGFKATEVTKSNYPRTSYRLVFHNVKASEVPDLIARESKKMGGKPSVSQRQNANGSYEVIITGRSIEPQHIDEAIVSADWFKHQTREEWLGVSPQTVSGVTGFYKEYQKSGGMFVVDGSGNPVPVSGSGNFVSLAGMRGDLDANWMASDPQRTSSGVTEGRIYAASANGPISGTGAVESTYTDPHHGDEHGGGWTGDHTWTDPDYNDGNEGSAAAYSDDQMRSHVITSVGVRINEDDSRDYTVTRTFPHQRRWEWQTTEENKDGDQRDIFHVTYRNWPSRKAIQTDLFDNFLSGKEASAEDGWGLAGSVTVNEFGLVDGGPITFKPNWDDEDHTKHKSIQPRGPFYEDLVKYDYSYRKPENAAGDEKTMRWRQKVHLLRVTGLATSRDNAEDWYEGYYSANSVKEGDDHKTENNLDFKKWDAGKRSQTQNGAGIERHSGDVDGESFFPGSDESRGTGWVKNTNDDDEVEVVGGYGIRFAGYHYGANNEWYEIDVTFVIGRDDWEKDAGNPAPANAQQAAN